MCCDGDAVDEKALILCCALCCVNCSVLPTMECFGIVNTCAVPCNEEVPVAFTVLGLTFYPEVGCCKTVGVSNLLCVNDAVLYLFMKCTNCIQPILKEVLPQILYLRRM